MIDLKSSRAFRVVLSVTVCAVMATRGGATAQQPHSAAAQKPKPKPTVPRKPKELLLTAAEIPMPALKYRFIPSSADLSSGDAAPIYLRLYGYEWNDAQRDGWKQISDNLTKWQSLPLDQFPVKEARQYVNLWSAQTEQLDFGARRKTCDWNYTLPEQRLEALTLALPDIQAMRQWGRLLAIKAHVEFAEGKVDEAIRTLETGIRFGRHVGDGLVLINSLVGIAIENVMLTELEQLIGQPNAPNLYWALTALPRPLVSVRNSLEVERELFESLVPEVTMAQLARQRNAAEWASHLERMHDGIVKWARRAMPENLSSEKHPLKIMGGTDLPVFKAKVLPDAREFLKRWSKYNDAQLAVMSDDQIVALYLALGHHDLWDAMFKGIYLPAREGIRQADAGERRLTDAKKSPLTMFAQMLPAIQSCLGAEMRLDARVAALRTVEAIRIYAAAHHGALPKSLSQVTEVPVPENPASGKPFEYQLGENVATLSAVSPLYPLDWGAPYYTITIRK